MNFVKFYFYALKICHIFIYSDPEFMSVCRLLFISWAHLLLIPGPAECVPALGTRHTWEHNHTHLQLISLACGAS